MTSQPSWPPLRGALKDSSANLMILQRPGLQSAARRRSLDTDPRRSLLLPRLGRNVSEEVTVKVLHFSFHSPPTPPDPLFPTCKSNDRVKLPRFFPFFFKRGSFRNDPFPQYIDLFHRTVIFNDIVSPLDTIFSSHDDRINFFSLEGMQDPLNYVSQLIRFRVTEEDEEKDTGSSPSSIHTFRTCLV